MAAVITGLGLPSFVFLIGDLIDSFGPYVSPEDSLKKIKDLALIFTYVALGIWFFATCYYGFLILYSERVALRTRLTYLKRVLE